jgi:hypothetical protein
METSEMKLALINKLRDLLQTEDISSASQEIRKIQKDYDLLLAKQIEREKEAFREDGGNMRDFVFQKSAEDQQSEALIKQFEERKKVLDQQISAEQEKNLNNKKQIIVEIEQLVNIEQGAGVAFKEFKNLQEKWESIGNVSPHKYKELQAEYSKAIEKFYYNLNIYRAMQEHDLKRNFELKTEVIEKIKKISDKENIKEVEQLIRAYRSEWDASGPVAHEQWDTLKEDYRTHLDAAYSRVKSFYSEQEQERENNLNAKKAILDKALALVQTVPQSETEWKQKTDELIHLQNEYKHTGFADKKQSDKVYSEFRITCDQFFEAKAKYYEVIKEQSSGVRKDKLAILQKLETLKDSKDWKQATQDIIKLQEAWKKSGSLPRNEEQRLFGKLRSISNHFFEEKRKYFESVDAQYGDNLKAKEVMLEEINQFQLTGDINADRTKLKEFSQRFQTLGMVPLKDKQRVNDGFYKKLDEFYTQMNMNANEKAQLQYSDKLDQLSAGASPDYALRKELDFLRKQQQEMDKNVQTLERNMGFFNLSKGKNQIVIDLEHKIDAEKNKVSAIIKKQKLVREYLTKLQAPASTENTDSNQ